MPARIVRIYQSVDEWHKEAIGRFGDDRMKWKFVCPSCGHVAAVADWKAAGATDGEVAFSCVGRHIPGSKTLGQKPGPCNYAGGGLFRLNPVEVRDGDKTHRIFDFADQP